MGLDVNNVAAIFEEDAEGFNTWHVGAGYGRKLTPGKLKQAALDGTIQTIITDTGTSSACVIPNNEQMQASECRMYIWDALYVASGIMSKNIFKMARGNTAAVGEEVQLDALKLR